LLDIELDGKEKQLKFIPDMGILCFHFFAELNEWIAEKGYEFAGITDPHCNIFIFFLSKETKKVFEEERGWEFQKNDYYWGKLQEDASSRNQYDKSLEYAKKGYDLNPELSNAAIYSGAFKTAGDFSPWRGHKEECKLLCEKFLEDYKDQKEDWFYKDLERLYKEYK
jgi:hypothetical protein